MRHIHYLILFFLLVLTCGCSTTGAVALQQKAEATKARIESRHARGKDVAEVVRLAKRVKHLADAGKLAEADVLLDKINGLLDIQELGKEIDGCRDLGIVEIRGYKGHSMEPFLSRDGKFLFFNNRNTPSDNTDLHWASQLGPMEFMYQGKVKGVNTRHLEGVPSMDRFGNFYFVSTREYENSRVSVFRGRFNEGEVVEVKPVAGISKRKAGWINMDLEVSANGDRLYFTHSFFSGKPVPTKSNLSMAVKDGDDFQEAKDSEELVKEINTDDLEYAPATSSDELTLYWTHARSIHGEPIFEIRRSTRPDVESPFGKPETMAIFKGHFEAPTLSPNNKTIYYHKLIEERFRICAVQVSGPRDIANTDRK